MRTISVVLLLLIASSCSSPVEPDPLPRFSAARARWDQNGLQNYRFTVHYQCFCGIFPHSAIVDVRQGTIESVRDADTGALVEQPIGMRTISGVLDLIAAALDAGADVVEVSYDKRLGYPREAFIDYSRHALDDELRILIHGVVSLD